MYQQIAENDDDGKSQCQGFEFLAGKMAVNPTPMALSSLNTGIIILGSGVRVPLPLPQMAELGLRVPANPTFRPTASGVTADLRIRATIACAAVENSGQLWSRQIKGDGGVSW